MTPPRVGAALRRARERPALPWAVYALLAATQVGVWLSFALASRSGPASTIDVAVTVLVIAFVCSRAVLGARHPSRSLRVVLYLAAHALSLLIADFAAIYFRAGTRANWSMPLSHVDALFVAVGTLTSAGAAGIEPRSEWARGVLTLQMGIDLVAVTLVTGLVIARLAERRRQH